MKLFEVSWEVCNKVGGIYTVISSKSNYIKKFFKEFFFIGPYLREDNEEFYEKEIPEEYQEIVKIMSERGVKVHYGKWIKNNTPTFLIEFRELFKEKNKIKTELWEHFKVDSLFSSFDFEEPVVWSYAVGMFLEEIAKKFENLNEKIIAHFHEWLCGAGLLYLKIVKAKVGTVFTTHATVLERALASKKVKFNFQENPEEIARQIGVIDKYTLEKQTILNADAFTTVSELVAESCEKIFGRKADYITINGLDLKSLPNLEEIPLFHKKNKEKIKDFVKSFFYPYYYFDVDNSLFYFISGRYEINSKGIDLFIKALGKLNKKMVLEKEDKTIVVFIFIPSGNYEENEEVIENLLLFKTIKERIKEHFPEIEDKILNYFISQKKENFFPEDFSLLLKRYLRVFRRGGIPPISTHKVKEDYIISQIEKEGLKNSEEDRVKIIYYPLYLSEKDGLLNLDYYEATSAFHLGIFPSFYEPWGYTPLESAALGVPAITTDYSGFGKYVLNNLRFYDNEERGVIVIKRENKSDEQVIDELVEDMHNFLSLSKNKRIKNKIIAETLALRLSWEFLIENYLNAYNLAVEKRFGI
ncbi:MAG: glycogen/starch synthase [Candidatus Pacearchaeota archaeon]